MIDIDDLEAPSIVMFESIECVPQPLIAYWATPNFPKSANLHLDTKTLTRQHYCLKAEWMFIVLNDMTHLGIRPRNFNPRRRLIVTPILTADSCWFHIFNRSELIRVVTKSPRSELQWTSHFRPPFSSYTGTWLSNLTFSHGIFVFLFHMKGSCSWRKRQGLITCCTRLDNNILRQNQEGTPYGSHNLGGSMIHWEVEGANGCSSRYFIS